MQLIKQSTVTTIYVGPVLDSSGAAVTNAVLADFRLIKNGTAATLTEATVTHDANGHYTIALTSTNTDTLGRLTIASGNTAHAMATHRYSVLLASVFDAIVANAANTTGGLLTATGSVTGIAGTLSTFAGGAVASVSGSVGSVTSPVTVGTNNDKSGYGLAADQAVNVTKVGGTSVSGPNDLKADVSGLATTLQLNDRTLLSGDYFNPATDAVTVGTNNDKTGYALAADQAVNVTKVGGTSVAGPNDLKADVSSLATAAQLNDRTLPAADYFDPAVDGVNVTRIAGVTTSSNAPNIEFPWQVGTSNLGPLALDVALADYGCAKESQLNIVEAAVSNIQTRLPATLVSGKMSSYLAPTDRTGFSLAADQAVNVTKVGGTSVSGPNDLKADVSGLATATQLNDRTLPAANYFDPTTDTVTVGTNNDKSGYELSADQAVNVTKVGGTSVAGPDDLKADVSGILAVTNKLDTMLVVNGLVYQWTTDSLALSPAGGGGDSASVIYAYFTDGTRANAFKADVSAIRTAAQDVSAETAQTNAIQNYVLTNVVAATTFQNTMDLKASVTDLSGRVPAALIGGKMSAVADGVTLDQEDIDQIADAVSASVGGEIVTEIERADGMLDLLSKKFFGITRVANWLAFIMGKTPDAPTLAEVNATTAGATVTNVEDSLEAIRNQGDAEWAGGGGGDATLAKQEEILSTLHASRVLTVASPNVKGDLVLIQGDTYDGIGNPKAQWAVTTDYTVDWVVTFTIRDENDVVIYTAPGTVASAVLVTVDITVPTGLDMCNGPRVWKGKYDVQLTKGSSVKTLALGSVYIHEDVTRE